MWGRRVWCTEAEGALGGDGGLTYDGCDGEMNSREHKRYNYATDWWILAFFCISVSPRGVRSSPHLQRQKELWGRWWEHVWFLWVTGELIGDGMRQFCGHWKESHHIFDGDGIGWFRRGGVMSFGSWVGPGKMFEAGWRKSHGRWLFGMANVIEIFFLCCLLALDNDVVPWFACLKQ